MVKCKLLVACLLIGSMTYAQSDSTASKAPTGKSDYVGLQFGSLGIGGQYVHPLNARWSLRFSGSYFSMGAPTSTIVTPRYTETRDVKGTVGGGSAIADFDISPKTPNWKLSMGAFYTINEVSQMSSFVYTENGNNKDVGTLDLTFTANPVSPYLGLVWGNFKTKKKLFFTLELGTLYHGKPKVSFTGTGLIEPTTQQDYIIADNVSNYNWFPYANFQLNYKLN